MTDIHGLCPPEFDAVRAAFEANMAQELGARFSLAVEGEVVVDLYAGWGGSCAFADPKRRISGAYVMNRQSVELIGDARARRLIDAAYAALG